MSFEDDEPIVANINGRDDADDFDFENANVEIRNAVEAPLEEFRLRVMLEVTALSSVDNRPGLDLVTVLDVSGSMAGSKMEKLKSAMEFMLKKLSPIDRLSIITFSDAGNRLCPLRLMTENSKKDVMELINNMVAGGNTNITDGLQKALQVLNERKIKDGRAIAIMLMSDGEQNKGGDAAQLQVPNVPVYTFKFGTGDPNGDPEKMVNVLFTIAKKSSGGTFSDIEKEKDLNTAFAMCLAGLLTVAVQGLIMNIAPKEGKSRIENISAGDYKQSDYLKDGSKNVTFGVLYQRETRKVLVDLVLFKVEKDESDVVVFVSVMSRSSNDLEVDDLLKGDFDSNISATVKRTGTFKKLEQKPEVIIEESRVEATKMMKEAREMADNNNMKGAKNKIVTAQNMLEDVDIEGSVKILEMLKQELDQFMAYLQSPELYKTHGRAFALSSELSHDRQRFAARGDMEKPGAFSTPRMEAYQEQAKSFDKDPTKPVPTVEEDQKKDIAADPLGPIIRPLTVYLQRAIQALQSIQTILKSASRRRE